MDADLFSRAARDLAAAVAEARGAGALDARLPEGSNPSGPSQTVREAAASAAYDLAWVPDVLAGRTAEEASPASREDDLLGEDAGVALGRLAEAAVGAAEALDDPERTTHLSYGDFPAREYLEHVTTYYGVLALDVRAAVGTPPPDELVEGLWRQLEPGIEQWRAMGLFGQPVDVPEGAPLVDRLRGLLGRRP